MPGGWGSWPAACDPTMHLLLPLPQVESLVGRASVADVALGEQHSVFLDARGGIWACGENKEGQCGLGTPIEVIAAQHRKAYFDGGRSARGGSGTAGSSGGAASRSGGASASGSSGKSGWAPRDQQLSQRLKSLMQQDPLHQQQHRAGMQAFAPSPQQPTSSSSVRAGWAGSSGLASLPSSGPSLVVSALGWGGFDMEGHLNLTGMQPGQLHTPVRIGRDQHPLSGLLHRTAQSEPGKGA